MPQHTALKKMNWSRREIVMAGLSLAAAGCSTSTNGLLSKSLPPVPPKNTDLAGLPRVPRPIQTPQVVTQNVPAPAPAPAPTPGNVLHVIPRTTWAKSAPVPSRLNLMGNVSRITVHHEGCPEPVEFADVRSTSARLELIRTVHVRDRQWGDIGYHFIIDRAGRVWEARPLQYQGAHVKNNNEHNIGIMLMGNFDIQRPTDAQTSALRQTVIALRRQHMVNMRYVKTHQEINPTRCPGKFLQERLVSLRSNGYLV